VEEPSWAPQGTESKRNIKNTPYEKEPRKTARPRFQGEKEANIFQRAGESYGAAATPNVAGVGPMTENIGGDSRKTDAQKRPPTGYLNSQEERNRQDAVGIGQHRRLKTLNINR